MKDMEVPKKVIHLDFREQDGEESYKIRPKEWLPFFIGLFKYEERVRKEKMNRMHLPPHEFWPYAKESWKRFGLLTAYNMGTTLITAYGIEKLLQ